MSKLNWHPPEIPRKIQVTFKWNEYSAEVHDDPNYPRPFTDVALNIFDFVDSFKQNYKGANRILECFIFVMDDFEELIKDIIDNYEWSYDSTNEKQYKNLPTWNTISDSEALKDSTEYTYSADYDI